MKLALFLPSDFLKTLSDIVPVRQTIVRKLKAPFLKTRYYELSRGPGSSGYCGEDKRKRAKGNLIDIPFNVLTKMPTDGDRISREF